MRLRINRIRIQELPAGKPTRELEITQSKGKLDILFQTNQEGDTASEALSILHQNPETVLFLLQGQPTARIRHNISNNTGGKPNPTPDDQTPLLKEPAWWLDLPERIRNLPKSGSTPEAILSCSQRDYTSPSGCTLAEALYLAGVSIKTETSQRGYPWKPSEEIVEISYGKEQIQKTAYHVRQVSVDGTKFQQKTINKPYPLETYFERYNLRKKELGNANLLLQETLDWGFPDPTAEEVQGRSKAGKKAWKKKALEATAELLSSRKPFDKNFSREEAVEIIGPARMAILLEECQNLNKGHRTTCQFLLNEILDYGNEGNYHIGIQNLAIIFYPRSGTRNPELELDAEQQEKLYEKDRLSLQQHIQKKGTDTFEWETKPGSFASILAKAGYPGIRILPKLELAGIIPPEARTKQLIWVFLNWWAKAKNQHNTGEGYYLSLYTHTEFFKAFFPYSEQLESLIKTTGSGEKDRILEFLEKTKTAIAEQI